MSADDQRAAERVRRDLDGGDPTSADIAALLASHDRLRAELAETRAALATVTTAWRDLDEGGREIVEDDVQPLAAALDHAQAWRSVRGDAPAPAEPPTNPKPARPTFRDDPHPLYPHFPARGPGAIEAALDRLSRYGSGAEVHDLLVSARAELEHLIPAGPLLERFPAPAVELPVTLSSVDDVAAVCERAGLGPRSRGWWMDESVQVNGFQTGACVVDRRTSADAHLPIGLRGRRVSELAPGAPSSLLLAAIEAARGGSR